MEFGGPHDEMVYGNFDQLKVELQQLENVIRKRMIMSGLQEIQLKSMQEQVAQHAEINKTQRKEAMDIIEKLLKTFPTQYNP
jgi:hypothetical protein